MLYLSYHLISLGGSLVWLVKPTCPNFIDIRLAEGNILLKFAQLGLHLIAGAFTKSCDRDQPHLLEDVLP
jgi:hypothetical protein